MKPLSQAKADLKASMENSDELDETADKLNGIQLGHTTQSQKQDPSFNNDSPQANDEAWGGWPGGGSNAGGWATGGQTADAGKDIPSWGANDESNRNHSVHSTGNSGIIWDENAGRDRSRSTHHGSRHGGSGPPTWGGEQERIQNHSSNSNTAAFRSATSNQGRYPSRDNNHGQSQGGGWAGDGDQSWGGETANSGRRSTVGGNSGRVAEAEVDW